MHQNKNHPKGTPHSLEEVYLALTVIRLIGHILVIERYAIFVEAFHIDTSYTYIYVCESQGGQLSTGHLEVGDDLGDVGVHLVKLGVLGGRLPVLATGHSVHDVLSEKGMTSFNQIILFTYLDEGQVGDNLRTALGAHLATRQLELEVGQLRPGELEGEPQQGGGQGSLGLRGESGGTADPGGGTLLLGDGGEVAH